MNTLDSIDGDTQTNQTTITTVNHRHYPRGTKRSNHHCMVCGSRAVGFNFGVPTCAPCKAFFRRNARRKEVLELSCNHCDLICKKEKKKNSHEKTSRYLQIRRCSSCRLLRCFELGMQEELIRTNEENDQHKQLVHVNRKRREMLKQEEKVELFIPQSLTNVFSSEIDWRHISNIVYAYDTCCLKTYVQQRANMFLNGTILKTNTVLPMNLAISLSSFIRALPAFQSLSRSNQFYICKNNIRPLIFPNLHELNQSCFSEPWEIASDKSTWQFICGSELYEHFVRSKNLAEKSVIADPVVTRLWLIILFFSTRLLTYYDPYSSTVKLKTKLPFIDIQNAYVNLLWKYLLHRHEYIEAVRIYSTLILVFLNMLRVGIDINIRLRTQKGFISTHETIDQLLTVDINGV